MAQLDNTSFENKYNDSGTGLFKSTGAGSIEGVDVRALVTDIKDSFLNTSDDASAASSTNIGVFQRKTTISSAEILAWNTTPVTVVPAAGAGKIIVPVAVFVWVNFDTTPYATNTDISIRCSTHVWDGIAAALSVGSDAFYYENIDDVNNTVDIRNQPLVLRSAAGNPTAGNSPIEVTVFYRVITVS